ncbi:uncharacterized protein LOC121369506 [Gigantopelta aegis]|uniref:uncharacterized protein LOC121369506 n=1 Tax=Gigantopelta aegis TaxID=1735272 RepID=UPI001B8879AC|nr:uncharacterized protein LOC121369506 [Gigantopelta aegis]
MSSSESSWLDIIGLGMKFVISTVASKFPAVQNVDTKQLAEWLNSSDRDVALLDCRDPREYEVSYMPGSVRVEWKREDVDQLVESLPVMNREGPAKKTIVCYCSLGYRSSALANKIQNHLKKSDNPKKVEVYNLAGSIFKWANEGRPLLNSEGQKTKLCHPYTPMWSRLLNKELHQW